MILPACVISDIMDEDGFSEILGLMFFLSLFFETEVHSVAQPGVQWCGHSSLQP